jgi:hypothetical protein
MADDMTRLYRLRLKVLMEVFDERDRQTAKHGDQAHLPDGTGSGLVLQNLPVLQGHARTVAVANDLERWARNRTKAASQNEGGDGSITMEMILTEEWAELIASAPGTAALYTEIIQTAAVLVQWAENIKRQAGQW